MIYPLSNFIKKSKFGYDYYYDDEYDDTSFDFGTVNVIQIILLVISLFLAFKCFNAKGSGVKVGELLAAVCCSPCYIAYRLAVPCK